MKISISVYLKIYTPALVYLIRICCRFGSLGFEHKIRIWIQELLNLICVDLYLDPKFLSDPKASCIVDWIV